MTTYRCPLCGGQSKITPADGCEIVSIYCLAHRSGLPAHTEPVLMEPVADDAAAAAAEQEAVPVA